MKAKIIGNEIRCGVCGKKLGEVTASPAGGIAIKCHGCKEINQVVSAFSAKLLTIAGRPVVAIRADPDDEDVIRVYDGAGLMNCSMVILMDLRRGRAEVSPYSWHDNELTAGHVQLNQTGVFDRLGNGDEVEDL